MAMAILTSRPNSHPFEERRLILTEPAKVGRSVAKSRPSVNNCIFDCKVLSRNHAILWHENEKFFLRDTKSSNGTFVNNVRLSKGSEESEPKEINSGDIVQFGVDVVENSKKVTHGCIIANVTLYLPNGEEATRSSSKSLFKVRDNGLPAQELWQLSQYLQDAIYREQMLENRLTALQRLIHSSLNVFDDNCQKFAQEDKLLSRLEMLENQIEALTRNLSEEDIKRKLLTLQEDRHNYEMRSKESLKRMLQEKLEAVQKLSEVERCCSSAEDECLHYKSLYEKSQQEMKELTERHAQRLEEMKSLQEQVEEAERRHAAVDEQANDERREFESCLEDARKNEAAFAARTLDYQDHLLRSQRVQIIEAESMQAQCDFAKEQLIAMKAQLDKRRECVLKSSENKSDNPKRIQDSEDLDDNTSNCVENLESQLGQEPHLFEETVVFSNEIPEQSSSDDLKILQAKLNKLENEVAVKENHLENFKEQLTETQVLLQDSREQVEALNEKLSKSREEAVDDKLKISKLEEEVMEYHLQAVDQLSFMDGVEHDDSNGYNSNLDEDTNFSQARLQSLLDKILKVNSLVKERRKRLLEWAESEETKLSGVNEVLMVNSDILEDETESNPLKLGLDGMQSIEDNFCDIEKLVEAEHEEGKQLKEELKNAQAYTKEFKQQIIELRDKLLEEQELTRKKDDYVASLRREINELSRERDLMQVEKNCEHQAVEKAKNAAREMQKQAAKSAESAGKNKVELSVVSEDNLSLKQKIQTLESELKKYRRENSRLSADYTKIQASYRDLELQNRAQHEKQLKQPPSTVEDLMKAQEAEWRKNIDQEKEKVANMQSYLFSLLAVIFAMILAYTLDFISISRGGRLGGS